jgi:hypothetical protein
LQILKDQSFEQDIGYQFESSPDYFLKNIWHYALRNFGREEATCFFV